MMKARSSPATLLAVPHEWEAEDARIDWRIAVGSIAAMWLFYFAITTALAAITDAPDQWGAMGRRGIVIGGGMAFTLILYLCLRLIQPRRFGWRLALAFGSALPLTMLYAVINLVVFFHWFPTSDAAMIIAEIQKKFPTSWQAVLLVDSTIRWYFFFAVWAALYVAFGYASEMRAVERRANTYRLEAKTAQLRALHYQVNPHFLFNTLNSLSALVMRERRSDAETMIMNLSAFLRSSLAVDPEQMIPLSDEIALQQLYLEIEQARFPDRLQVVNDVPDALQSVAVPVLILQPIIENAIKYGVAPTRKTVAIHLTATQEHGLVVIRISNDVDPGATPPAQGTGLGLNNVRERLMTRFGARAGCEWGPDGPTRFVVSLWLPQRGEATT
jgi:signal transduction histidine kinase